MLSELGKVTRAVGKMLEPLVSKRVVAQWLGITERGVENMTQRGVLPAYNVGGRLLRYSPTEVKERLNVFRVKRK